MSTEPTRPPQSEVAERLGVVKGMVQEAMLPVLRIRYPDMQDANLMELLSTVALSGVLNLGNRDLARDMLQLQLRSLEPAAPAGDEATTAGKKTAPLPAPASQDEFNAETILVMERMRPLMIEILERECALRPWLTPGSVMELMVILAMSGVYAYSGRKRALECAVTQRQNYEALPEYPESGTLQ